MAKLTYLYYHLRFFSGYMIELLLASDRDKWPVPTSFVDSVRFVRAVSSVYAEGSAYDLADDPSPG